MAIRFRVEGDLRFISHHDMMRLFERALSRAQLPVSFSEGFNPRPRMSLPLPRPVGVGSSADMLVVELCEPVGAACVLDRLQGQMPQGLTLVDACELQPGQKLHPEGVSYEVPVPDDLLESVRQAVKELCGSPSWQVERVDEHGRLLRSVDLKSLLIEAQVEPGLLRWTHRTSDHGSARPGEWLTAFGLNPAEMLHRVQRSAVAWRTDPPAGAAVEPIGTPRS